MRARHRAADGSKLLTAGRAVARARKVDVERGELATNEFHLAMKSCTHGSSWISCEKDTGHEPSYAPIRAPQSCTM